MPPVGGSADEEGVSDGEVQLITRSGSIDKYLTWLLDDIPMLTNEGVLDFGRKGKHAWRKKFPNGPHHTMIDPSTVCEEIFVEMVTSQPPKHDSTLLVGKVPSDMRALVLAIFTLAMDFILVEPCIMYYNDMCMAPGFQVKNAQGLVTGCRPLCFRCGTNEYTKPNKRGWAFRNRKKAPVVRGKIRRSLMLAKTIWCDKCYEDGRTHTCVTMLCTCLDLCISRTCLHA